MIASDVQFIFAASGEPLAVDGVPFVFRTRGYSIDEVCGTKTERERHGLTDHLMREREINNHFRGSVRHCSSL